MDIVSGQTPRVLIVENNSEVLELVTSMVAALGWQAIPASSLAEAHAQIIAHAIDAVITDMVLGDGDGLALIRELAANRERPIPALMISSYFSPELRRTAQQAGAIDLLAKPFRMERLSGLLEDAIRERGFHPAPASA